MFAISSTIPQFSGPFNPRPADTTISASLKLILPDAFTTSFTFTLLSVALTVTSKFSTEHLFSVFSGATVFGVNAMILFSE